jgi:hypothetical protein
LAALLMAAPSFSASLDVDFDAETPFEIVTNGSVGSETPLDSFNDTVGANLQLATKPLLTNGSNGLRHGLIIGRRNRPAGGSIGAREQLVAREIRDTATHGRG